jgi:hypothetical protein
MKALPCFAAALALSLCTPAAFAHDPSEKSPSYKTRC